MTFLSEDPGRDFDRYDMALAQKEARLPQCERCGCHIHDTYYEINNEILCECCMRDEYSRSAEDWLNDY